jgi:hypothetical protein
LKRKNVRHTTFCGKSLSGVLRRDEKWFALVKPLGMQVRARRCEKPEMYTRSQQMLLEGQLLLETQVRGFKQSP